MQSYGILQRKFLSGSEATLLTVLIVDLLNIDLPFQLSIIQGINSLYLLLPIVIFLLVLLKLTTGKVFLDRTAITTLYLIFVIYVLLNSIYFSISPDISIRYALLIASWFLAFLLFSQFRTLRLERVIILYLYILAVYFLISIAFSAINLKPRLSSITLGDDASRMGMLAFFGLASALYLSRVKRFRNEALKLSVILVFIISLVYSGSRTIYLILFLAGVLGVFGNRIFRFRDSLILLLLSGVTLTVLFVTGDIYGNAAIENQMSKLLSTLSGDNENEVSRLVYFEFAKVIFFNNPNIIFSGIGLESYLIYEAELEDIVGRVNVLHNMYLQYMIGLGVIGFSIFCFYLSYLLRTIRGIEQKLLRDFLTMLMLGFFVYGIFHPNTVSRGMLFYLPLFTVLCVRRIEFTKDIKIGSAQSTNAARK